MKVFLSVTDKDYERRTMKQDLRISPKEKELLKVKAKQLNMSVGDLIRIAVNEFHR